MSELDERLRQLVRKIGEAAPPPPRIRDVPTRTGRRAWGGPLVAAASFAVVLLGFGAARLFFSPGFDSTGATADEVSVRHQVIELTLVADLSCEQRSGAGTSAVRLETWADFTQARFRQVATYPDGSVRDRIALGDLNYPLRTYGRGDSKLVLPVCGEDILSNDPTSGPDMVFFNPPVASPNTPGYEELGSIVPGDHTDGQGRPAALYRQVVGGGFALFEDGTEAPIYQVTDWYVDEATGEVLETTFSQTIDGRYDVNQTMVVVSDETITIDGAMFSTDGYQLEWNGGDGSQGPRIDAEPVEPTVALGTEVIWPEPLEPAGPQAVAERFAREVLEWDSPTVTLDREAEPNAPTFTTLDDGRGHQLSVLTAPNGADGWGIYQVGNPIGLGVAPLGYASIRPQAVADATRITIHVTNSEGTTLAWQADLTGSPGTIVLPGIQAGEVGTLLVAYQDADGNTLTAGGSPHGGTALDTPPARRWACSAAEEHMNPAPQADLPSAVAETRRAIVTAAGECDYEALDALAAAEDSPSFGYDLESSFDSPGAVWLALEVRGYRVTANLVRMLNDPYLIEETEFGLTYIWPALDEDSNAADRPLVGISEEGRWVFLIFGDRLMPDELLDPTSTG